MVIFFLFWLVLLVTLYLHPASLISSVRLAWQNWKQHAAFSPHPSSQEFHKQFFRKAGYTPSHVLPPAEVRRSSWYSLLPSREKEVFGFAISQSAATDFLSSHSIATASAMVPLGMFPARDFMAPMGNMVDMGW